MWADAQRDGRPAEYRWHPLLNAAKFGWRPLLECHAVTLSIQENARLGRKVNFAPGKIPLLGKSPRKCIYIAHQPMRRPNIVQSLVGFRWATTSACEAKTRNPLKFAGVPQTITNRSQPLVCRSSPYCKDMWRRYCCLIVFFFRLSICALVVKI